MILFGFLAGKFCGNLAGGNLAGFFRTHKIEAQKIGENYSGRTKRVSTKGISMIRAISGNFP